MTAQRLPVAVLATLLLTRSAMAATAPPPLAGLVELAPADGFRLDVALPIVAEDVGVAMNLGGQLVWGPVAVELGFGFVEWHPQDGVWDAGDGRVPANVVVIPKGGWCWGGLAGGDGTLCVGGEVALGFGLGFWDDPHRTEDGRLTDDRACRAAAGGLRTDLRWLRYPPPFSFVLEPIAAVSYTQAPWYVQADLGFAWVQRSGVQLVWGLHGGWRPLDWLAVGGGIRGTTLPTEHGETIPPGASGSDAPCYPETYPASGDDLAALLSVDFDVSFRVDVVEPYVRVTLPFELGDQAEPARAYSFPPDPPSRTALDAVVQFGVRTRF